MQKYIVRFTVSLLLDLEKASKSSLNHSTKKSDVNNVGLFGLHSSLNLIFCMKTSLLKNYVQ